MERNMSYNNIYNFKNPIKHFIDIDSLIFSPTISTLDIEDTCWTIPIKFKINKDNTTFRTLKLPNIIALVCGYEHFKTLPHFDNPQELDPIHKRLSTSLATGDFKIGEYDIQLENDFNNLCVYDNLLKLDIKEFYGRLYTHYLDFHGFKDRYITNLNNGATNGLIMGNYLSLYFAEQHLVRMSNDINQQLNSHSIDCEFSYFSDDFYFFCNKHDNQKIIELFDEVLDKYDLERNEKKIEIWDYESFNSNNLIARYWKKVIAHCNTHYSSESNQNKLVFINQLLYRSSKLNDIKLKKVFIINFFKTKYFRTLNLEQFYVKEYDYHQLCYLFRTAPEALLYCIDKFTTMQGFDKSKVYKFFNIRFRESLKSPYNDEQLYLYYAICLLGFNDILVENKTFVLNSDNQILISYYLKDGLFTENEICLLKSQTDECYWFQSYHLILYTPDLFSSLENNILTYLIPKKCLPSSSESTTNANRRLTYMTFYKNNLMAGNSIILDISEVELTIHEYLDLRFEEEENLYLL